MLEQLVKEMPIVTRLTLEKHQVTGAELIDQGHNKSEIDPNKVYAQNMPVVIARNHLNGLKRAFKADPKKGLGNYIASVTKIVNKNV